MKTKLAILAFILISSSGCMTTTNSYTRDIVYRDGSYYSPADEQYGDYYYEPEPDYSYYDNYNYGFGYYDTSYRGYGSSRCRFSYRYDRYCDRGWGSSYLHFGGLSIFFGDSNYYGYPGYGYYNGYPYYGWHSPRPRPHDNNPIPMPKPTRPSNQTPDNIVSNAPGMRVSGEPIRMPTKPGRVITQDGQTVEEPQDRQNRNPYTRTRQPRPEIHPENWRDSQANSDTDDGVVIRERNSRRGSTKPMLLRDDSDYAPSERPVRQSRRPRPSSLQDDNSPEGQQPRASNSAERAAPERSRRDNRQERATPRIEQRERTERSERSGSNRTTIKESSDGRNP